jgi:hypothetical protein
MFNASMGGNYQIASITALILRNPSVGFMLVIERFLKADVIAKIGSLRWCDLSGTARPVLGGDEARSWNATTDRFRHRSHSSVDRPQRGDEDVA